MKGIKNLIKNVLIFIKILFIFILYLLFYRNNSKKKWLICETDITAQDNGYYFFKWMRKNHPEIKTYYLLNKQSKSYRKIACLGNVIPRLSFHHILYLFMAEKHIGTHDYRHWAYPGKREIFQLLFERFMKGEYIQLQHGISHMKGERGFYYNPILANYDKIVVCSEFEKKLLNEYFGHPEKNLIETGFARYDRLYGNHELKNQIFFMPTWRKEIRKRKLFLNSEYYLRAKELLTNKSLLKVLRRNNVKFKFYLHIKLQKFIDLFKVMENDTIEIIEVGQENIQDLLIESKLLITDYSSISFDFIYMNKPVVFYQYDYEDYVKSYKVEGYRNYKKDRFGYIAYNSKDLINKVSYYVENKFKVEEEYIKKSNKYFKYRDSNNCERIFDAINNTGVSNVKKNNKV